MGRALFEEEEIEGEETELNETAVARRGALFVQR
jgi:hypothetical protein